METDMLKLLLIYFSIVLASSPCFAFGSAEYASTEKDFSKDNYVLLREYIDRIMAEKDKYYELCFRNSQNALSLSKTELDRRLEDLNELRKSVEKDRAQFVKLETFNFKIEAEDSLIASLDKRITVIETRILTWVGMIGALFFIIQISLWIWFQKRNNKRGSSS